MSASHLNSFVPTSAHNFVGHEIHAIYLVCMSGEVCLDFVCLEVPKLFCLLASCKLRIRVWLTLSVLSLLALTSNLESADHVSRYTAPTWPLSVATNLNKVNPYSQLS